MIEYTQKMDISMVRGDTLTFGVETIGLSETVDQMAMTCRTAPNASEYIFMKTLEDGIVPGETEDDRMIYTVRVAPEDTADISPGVYYYDIQMIVDEDEYTPVKGKLYIDWDVTR